MLVGVWLLFGPGLLALPLVWAGAALPASAAERLPLALSFAFSAVVLWRTTANFVRKRRLPPPPG